MHVVDEVLLVHDIHLGDKLLLDDLGHGDGVLVVPPDLGDPLGRPPAQRRQEVLLEPGVEILRDAVALGADVDLLAARPRPAAPPAVHGSHLILSLHSSASSSNGTDSCLPQVTAFLLYHQVTGYCLSLPDYMGAMSNTQVCAVQCCMSDGDYEVKSTALCSVTLSC